MEIKKENMEWLAEAMHYVKSKVNENLPKYSTVFPTSSSENLIYGEMGNKDWTEGFWTGILWLLYEDTNEEKYLSALETLLRTFQERLDQNIGLNTHDIGFLYSLSTLVGYKITGNEKALEFSVRAADYLMERYSEKTQIIQAWGVYGFALSYAHTGILACGLLELSKHLQVLDPRKKEYEETAVQIVKSLFENYTTEKDLSNGIIKHGVYAIPSHVGVDECCIWGDYFYVEALMRLRNVWNMYW